MGTYENIETRLFIGGEFVAAKSGKTFPIHNPATEEHVIDVHEAGEEDINLAVEYAKKAQQEWEALGSMKRAAALHKLADLLTPHLDEFHKLDAISWGVTKAPFTMLGVLASVWIHYYAELGNNVAGESSLRTADRLDMVWKQPYGVTAAIIPWNGPLVSAAMILAASVAAGNAIILKTSEKAPLSLLLFAKIVKESGVFPPGLIQIVGGHGPTTGQLIASHMEIRKLAFVGSINSGKKVAEAAAKSNLKNVTLELGGKSPLIVFPDANLEKAAMDAALSIGLNSGQVCVASSRVYVHESIREKFIEQYKNAFSNLLSKAGDPLDPSTTHGPQADKLQFEHVMRFLDKARADGVKTVLGGDRLGNKGYFIQPTVFVDAPESHDVVQKEIFGPVSALSSFTDEDEVLKRANDTEYGLYASVYTQDVSRAIRVAKKLEAGTVAINASSPTMGFDLPFGGWKQSGSGRQSGRPGFESWLETKTVFLDLKA